VFFCIGTPAEPYLKPPSQAMGGANLLQRRCAFVAILCIILVSGTVEDGTDAHDSAGFEAASLDSADVDAPALQGKVGHEGHRDKHPAGHVGRATARRIRRSSSDEAASLFQQALHQEMAAGVEASRDVMEANNQVIQS